MNNNVYIKSQVQTDGLLCNTFSVLIAGCIIFPYTYMNAKIYILALAILFGLLERRAKLRIFPSIFIWYIAYIFYYIIWILWGFFQSNPIMGLISSIKSGVLYTAIFMIITGFLTNKNRVENIFKLIILCNFINALIAISFTILSLLRINTSAFIAIMGNSVDGITTGDAIYTSGRFINEMFFTTPFLLVAFFTWNDRPLFIYINVVLSVITAMISGRRVIQVIVMAIIVFFLVFYHNKEKSKKRKRTINFIGIVILLLSLLTLQNLMISKGIVVEGGFTYRLQKAFTLNSENARYVQYFHLMNGFKQSPLMGSGISGVLSNGYRRSIGNPWLFELSYVALLFHCGILGTAFYFIILCTLYKFLYNISKIENNNKYVLPLFMGYSSLLLANIVDPYIGTFDMMWMIFIIPIYYNSVLNHQKWAVG